MSGDSAEPDEPEELPDEAAGLFASEAFVEERNRLAKQLRDEGRREEAALVALLRKPPRLVVSVNRAARELPLQAKAAARAAEQLATAQAAGDRRRFDEASARLDKAVGQLVERAVASGADRIAVTQLVRAALTSQTGRQELAEGSLREPPESAGFDVLAGMAITSPRRPATAEPAGAPRREARAAREKRRKLEKRLSEAMRELRAAERAEARARQASDAAANRVQAIQADLDRLTEVE